MVTPVVPSAPPVVAPDPAHEEAVGIFHAVWPAIEERIISGRAFLPRELIWLGGAPGAGKGTNTNFILRERGISAGPIVTSSLLESPEMKKLKDGGNLVGDREVVGILFERLLEPLYGNGVLIDGFPRTRVQVECVKLLYQKMLELRQVHRGGPREGSFPKPFFQIVVLYVEEKESIERQLKRGRQIIAHNARVRETGEGELQEERATDLNEVACKKRYQVFMEKTYAVLLSLKQHFHFHVINAQGDIGTVERAINREFQYQSSLELDDETFDAIHHLPLASDIVLNARQHLVRRLDSYQRDHGALFRRVIGTLESDFVPVIVTHAITGLCKITTENELFADPLAITMLVDVLNERGYRTTATVEARDIPTRIDPATQFIICTKRPRYRFEIRFAGSTIRRGL
jgi:adenylate kinase